MYHEQKTAGIMGFLPCVLNMHLRIAQTNTTNKSVIFKHRRCRLHGWKLRSEDASRLEKCSTPEMKLEYIPEELFVKIPNATWIRSPELGPGVIGLKPTISTCFLDKFCKIGIRGVQSVGALVTVIRGEMDGNDERENPFLPRRHLYRGRHCRVPDGK